MTICSTRNITTIRRRTVRITGSHPRSRNIGETWGTRLHAMNCRATRYVTDVTIAKAAIILRDIRGDR
jgi:hypothetical protein